MMGGNMNSNMMGGNMGGNNYGYRM